MVTTNQRREVVTWSSSDNFRRVRAGLSISSGLADLAGTTRFEDRATTIFERELRELAALRIIQVRDRLAITRGLPKSIVCDNGPEFAGHALDLWAHDRGVARLKYDASWSFQLTPESQV